MYRDNYLPKPIAEIVDMVCGHSENRQSRIQPPDLLIPIDSGNGRTRIIRTIADRYYQAEAREFSSRDFYLEFKLTGSVTNIYETHLEIQESAEYANHYCGIVALDVTDLLPSLNDLTGDKFFNMVNDVKRHATLVIFVPADCPAKQINLIAEKIGASIQLIPPVEPSLRDMARAFSKSLPKKSLTEQFDNLDFDKHEQAVAEFLGEILQPNMRKVIELSKSMPFNADACQKLSDKIEKGALR